MGVRLIWTDNNLSEDGHRVYRSLTSMDPEALPSPLVTLGADVELYDDGGALADTVYYYIVSAFTGATEKLSDEVSIDTTIVIPTWHPSDLFAGAEIGGCWNFNDPSTVFIDSAGTTPAINDGDLIGRINDISGTGLDLTVTGTGGDANKFILRTGTTNHGEGILGTGSGNSRVLSASIAALVYPFTFMMAGDSTGVVGNGPTLVAANAGTFNQSVFCTLSTTTAEQGPELAVYNATFVNTNVGDPKGKVLGIGSYLSGSQFIQDEEGKVSSSINQSNPSGVTLLTLGGLIRSTSHSSNPGKYTTALYINRELTTQEKIDLTIWAMTEVG